MTSLYEADEIVEVEDTPAAPAAPSTDPFDANASFKSEVQSKKKRQPKKETLEEVRPKKETREEVTVRRLLAQLKKSK